MEDNVSHSYSDASSDTLDILEGPTTAQNHPQATIFSRAAWEAKNRHQERGRRLLKEAVKKFFFSELKKPRNYFEIFSSPLQSVQPQNSAAVLAGSLA